MKRMTLLACAGLLSLGGIGAAQAQQPNAIQGTPGSLFPYAAPHEVRVINGVPCRTVLDPNTNTRIPVECAGRAAAGGLDVSTTGSVNTGVTATKPLPARPASAFPYAAPHEIRMINGVPCRTVLDPNTNTRVPVACAR